MTMEDLQGFIARLKSDTEGERPEEEIFASFQNLLQKDAEVAEKIAETLATLSSEKSARLLRRMLDFAGEKKVRKTIKRSLYRLESRGIIVSEGPVKREASILRPLRAEPPKGFATSIDYTGHRLLVLVVPHAGRGWSVIHGLISDQEGLKNILGEEMSRKEFRGFFERFRQELSLPLVEMEPSYIGYLFTQSYQATVDRERTPPQGYLSLKSEIESIKKEYERPLIYAHLRLDEVSEETWRANRGGDLLKNDLLADWRIEESLIRPYSDAVRETEASKLFLNQTQKEARFQEIYLKALSELFPDPRRSLYKRRLEEMAYVLLKLGKEEDARTALSTAIDLEKPLQPLQPNPFLFQLVVKSIFIPLAKDYEQQKKEPSLIVKP